MSQQVFTVIVEEGGRAEHGIELKVYSLQVLIDYIQWLYEQDDAGEDLDDIEVPERFGLDDITGPQLAMFVIWSIQNGEERFDVEAYINGEDADPENGLSGGTGISAMSFNNHDRAAMIALRWIGKNW